MKIVLCAPGVIGIGATRAKDQLLKDGSGEAKKKMQSYYPPHTRPSRLGDFCRLKTSPNS